MQAHMHAPEINMIEDTQYQEDYYKSNGQSGDRPALLLFERLAKRYFARGAVLDFGCGAGHLLRRLGRTFETAGVEASGWARAQAIANTGAAVYESTRAVATESMVGVVSVHVVEHIPDPALREVFSEWRRILQPGGKALIVTPDAGGYAAGIKGKRWIALTDPTHINLKTHRQWEEFFRSCGFEVLKAGSDGLWDFPYRFSWLGKAEVFLFGWSTLIQFLAGRLWLRPGRGESSIYLLKRS